ncbi:unnamed protein product, partial [Brassica oleracea]
LTKVGINPEKTNVTTAKRSETWSQEPTETSEELMYRRSQKPADHQKEDVAPETKAGEISAEGDTVSRKLKPNK